MRKRLDVHIAEKYRISRNKAQKLIRSNQVEVSGKAIVDKDYIIRSNEDYTAHNIQIQTSTKPNHNIILNIIYEDEDIIIINKQSGLTVHPGAGTNNDTLLNALIARFPNYNIKIVHRLDKDTSGLMVVTKNEESHNILSTSLANRQIRREYLAVVWGKLNNDQGIIKTHITPKRSNRKVMCVAKTIGKLAVTHYVVEKNMKRASLVKCILETGRTHQVRVHMSHIGHSIIGDQVYGKNSSKSIKYAKHSHFICNFNRQALHAYKLGLYHPKTKDYMEFYSDLPEDIDTLINEFKSNLSQI